MMQGSTITIEYIFNEPVDDEFIDSIVQRKFKLVNGLETIEKNTGVILTNESASITLTSEETKNICSKSKTEVQFMFMANNGAIIQSSIAILNVEDSLYYRCWGGING